MPFDYLLFLVFLGTQCRLSLLCMRSARRRWSGWKLPAARAAILLFDLSLAIGYLFTFSELVARLYVPSWLASSVGAAALAYLLAAAAALAVYEVFRQIGKRLGAETDPSRRRLIHATGGVLMAAPLAAIGYGTFVERVDFRVRQVDVPLPGLPPGLDGVRILHLSDIHLSAFLSETELARVMDAARELRPHLAVVTGDLISSRGDPLDACLRQLSRLKTDAGTFGCMGNHERYAHAEDYTFRAGARLGIQLLRHQAHQLRFGPSILNLAGIDYQPLAQKHWYLHGAERLLTPGACNLLLSHNPDVFPVAARQGYNLVLAGHTHGGQVTVEILEQSLNAARFLTPYVYGLYRRGPAAAYVTRGIGTIGIPTRIGAPPEIAVLRLRTA